MATIASLLADHVTLEVRSVDRILVAGYLPRLQTEGLVVRFLLDRGYPVPSPYVLGKIGAVSRGDRPFRHAQSGPGRAFRQGRLQGGRRAPVPAGGRARGPLRRGHGRRRPGALRRLEGLQARRLGGASHFCYRRMAAFPNHYSFYLRDPEWGPAFIKTVAYAPFPVWLCLNGHESARECPRICVGVTERKRHVCNEDTHQDQARHRGQRHSGQ
jgi:hypothetical protein